MKAQRLYHKALPRRRSAEPRPGQVAASPLIAWEETSILIEWEVEDFWTWLDLAKNDGTVYLKKFFICSEKLARE